LENNADYQYNLKLIDNSKLYAQWQKSLNVPDLNLGAGWDQNGGTFKNEVNLLVGIPFHYGNPIKEMLRKPILPFSKTRKMQIFRN
jgi:cobalt-zinc-cadmium efflux system outer membrane protein